MAFYVAAIIKFLNQKKSRRKAGLNITNTSDTSKIQSAILAILFESSNQILCNHLRGFAFNHVALNHVHKFSIFK